jgi:hypothetical protein
MARRAGAVGVRKKCWRHPKNPVKNQKTAALLNQVLTLLPKRMRLPTLPAGCRLAVTSVLPHPAPPPGVTVEVEPSRCRPTLTAPGRDHTSGASAPNGRNVTHAITCFYLDSTFYWLHNWRDYSRTVGCRDAVLHIIDPERRRSPGRIVDCYQNVRRRQAAAMHSRCRRWVDAVEAIEN